MDYHRKRALKIIGHARTEDARLHPELAARSPGRMPRPCERLFFH